MQRNIKETCLATWVENVPDQSRDILSDDQECACVQTNRLKEKYNSTYFVRKPTQWNVSAQSSSQMKDLLSGMYFVLREGPKKAFPNMGWWGG